MNKTIQVAANAVASEAAIMSRIANGAERRAILRIVRALRDPIAVDRLLDDHACEQQLEEKEVVNG